MGRRDKYETNVKPYLEEIPKWLETMTEQLIAKKLGVAESSFQLYKTKYPELMKALIGGREILVEQLKDTLRMKAKGYYYTETKVKTRITAEGEEVTYREEFKKYAQPDTGAIHLLLKNFDEHWRNDDRETMDIKREQLELKKKQAESEW